MTNQNTDADSTLEQYERKTMHIGPSGKNWVVKQMLKLDGITEDVLVHKWIKDDHELIVAEQEADQGGKTYKLTEVTETSDRVVIETDDAVAIHDNLVRLAR